MEIAFLLAYWAISLATSPGHSQNLSRSRDLGVAWGRGYYISSDGPGTQVNEV